MDFFEMHLTHSAFKAMQEGNKNIEIRLYDEKRRELKKDDIISFLDIITENVINTRVISINIFSSFKILYERYPKNLWDMLKVKLPIIVICLSTIAKMMKKNMGL